MVKASSKWVSHRRYEVVHTEPERPHCMYITPCQWDRKIKKKKKKKNDGFPCNRSAQSVVCYSLAKTSFFKPSKWVCNETIKHQFDFFSSFRFLSKLVILPLWKSSKCWGSDFFFCCGLLSNWGLYPFRLHESCLYMVLVALCHLSHQAKRAC